MAQAWPAKVAAEVVERRWTPILDNDDAIAAVSAAGSGVTVDSYTHEDGDAVITLSAGTAGTEGVVTVTVTTAAGLTLIDAFYIPIRIATVLRTVTVADACTFALRKIAGDGETPDATQMAMAIEMLTEMLGTWRLGGVDLGVTGTLVSSDTLDIPDEHISAIKYCLRVAVYNHYGAELTAIDLRMADLAERWLAGALAMPGELTMPPSLTVNDNAVWELFN